MVKMVLTWEKGQIVFSLKNGKVELPNGCVLPNGLTNDMISQAYNRHLILGTSNEDFYLRDCLISPIY